MHGFRTRAFADLIGMDTVQPGARGISAVGVMIRERGAVAAGVPFLAAGRTSLTTDADIEVDDQTEFF